MKPELFKMSVTWSLSQHTIHNRVCAHYWDLDLIGTVSTNTFVSLPLHTVSINKTANTRAHLTAVNAKSLAMWQIAVHGNLHCMGNLTITEAG